MGVEEVLVLRVVDEAHRRRVRRAVAAGLLAIVAAFGVAIGMTHRSGAGSSLASAPGTGGTGRGPVQRSVDAADRSAIYDAARARYADTAGAQTSTHMEFAGLTINGTDARLLVNFVCVPLCGHGEELMLKKLDGIWQVVAVRTSWLSFSHQPAS
jgi:hypothetical protein